MKQLILIRHGEAGFSDGVDFQRQLTARGKENLVKLGETLSNREIKVDLLYCSSATRTRETAEILKQYIEISEEILSKEIYEGHLDSLVKLLEKTPNTVETCMLIGHNPTISLLVSHLTDGDYVGLQPGMCAFLNLEINDWMIIGHDTATLVEVLQ